MTRRIVYFATLFVLMLITGVFWGTWFTLTRTIDSFSDAEFTHIGKVIITNVAIPMSIILPIGVLFIIVSLFLYENKSSVGFTFGLLSFLLVVVMLLVTLLILVPIDDQIKGWTTVPSNFEVIRYKWETFHVIRTSASILSFAFYAVAVLTDKPKEYRSPRHIFYGRTR
jgi:hypothetical protein